MSKSEAFCTQCGSLILVDDSKEISNCIFCTSEIYTNEALELHENPEKVSEIQKQYAENPEPQFINPEEKKEIKKSPVKSKQGKKGKGKNTQEIKVEKMPTVKTEEITVMRPLPKKTKLFILASSVAFIVLIAAIFVPLITFRNAARTSMDEKVENLVSIPVEDYTFRYLNNRELWILTEENIDEDTAKEVYSEYFDIYETQYGDSVDQIRNILTVRIFAPEGTYLCEYVGDALSLTFKTATPTATPEPTTAIE